MSKTENTQENSQEKKIVGVRNQILQLEATNSSVFRKRTYFVNQSLVSSVAQARRQGFRVKIANFSPLYLFIQ